MTRRSADAIADTPRMTISAGAQRQMHALLAAQPEAGPWLGLLSVVLEECANPAWDATVAATRLLPRRAPDVPLLAGAEIPVDAELAGRWLRRVLTLAAETGAEAVPLRALAAPGAMDHLALLEAAIAGDGERIAATAAAADPRMVLEPLAAAAGLAAMPLLQALRRHFGGAVDPSWSEGACPVCGDWPQLAELRGLERARRLRCGRCGGDWAQPGIRCPYCGVTGHAARSALVAEQDGEARKVEICRQCRGYLKAVSTLRAWAGDEIPLADLATVDLDLVALEREYERPVRRKLEPSVTVGGEGGGGG